MNRPTMRDIGEALGVSTVTVSKALAGKPGMSDRMRAKKWMTIWNASVQYQARPLVQRTVFYREAAILDDYDGYRVPAGASVLRTENADYGLSANFSLNTSSRLSLIPAGTPSMIHPRAAPWLSPKVVTVNNFPKLLPLIAYSCAFW